MSTVTGLILCLLARLFEQGTEELPLFASFNDILAAVDVLDQVGDDCDASLADPKIKEAEIRFQIVLRAGHGDSLGNIPGSDEQNRVGLLERG